MRLVQVFGVSSLMLVPACQGSPDEAPPSEDASASSVSASSASAVEEVIAAERAFSAMAVEEGTKAAFLHFFHDSVITFGPNPAVGRQAVADGPDLPPLEWWPAVAEASADGEMGYTTGPYRATRPDGTYAWGHYHSVWQRQADGEWRVLIDMGGPHAEVPVPTSVDTPSRELPPEPPGSSRLQPLLDAARACDLRRADDVAALLDCAWLDARIHRPGRVPFQRADDALAELQAAGEKLIAATEGARTAASDDLGFTWGTGSLTTTPDSTTPMSFARFWRRDGEGRWRMVVEVVGRSAAGDPG